MSERWASPEELVPRWRESSGTGETIASSRKDPDVTKSPGQQRTASQPPMSEATLLGRVALYLLIVAVGTALDLWSKHAVFQWRGIPRPDNEWWIIENYFGIESAMNPGALFGIGAGWSTLFAGLSIAAAIGIVAWLFIGKAARDLWLTIALAAITAGIFGNLYDRLGYGMTDDLRQQYVAAGYPEEFIAVQETSVRDWILLRWKTKENTWPNFNIADMLLVCGAASLVVRSFQKPGE